jgi:AraC family transcriptional regulator
MPARKTLEIVTNQMSAESSTVEPSILMNQLPLTRDSFSPITLGEKLKTVEINGLLITETAHKANQRLPRHYHEHPNIAFVLNGSFREVLDRRHFDCGLNSVIVKPGGEAHANQYDHSGLHCLLIEIQPSRVASIYPVSKIFDKVTHTRAPILSLLALRIYKETRVMDSASHLAIEGLSLEMIAELSRNVRQSSESKRPRWLKDVLEILHAHFSEPISFTAVAETVGVHPVHVAREFRRFFGETMGEYLRRLRIEFACRKLVGSNLPLADIALESGFSHQAHFSRLFKRQIGLTPSEFRGLCSRR